MHRLLTVLSLLTLLAAVAWADGPQVGTIDGRITDLDGNPLPGVSVTLTGDRGASMSISKSDGSYRFALLPPGAYEITATLEGFRTAEARATLDTGKRRTVDLSMGVETAEQISVVAEAPLVDKYTTGASAAMDVETLENVPFASRSFQGSVETLPGVVHDATSRFQGDTKFAVNGGQDTEVATFIDGVDTTVTRFAGARTFFPTTALEEVRVDTASGAEYGRVIAGVMNTTVKSGTNRFHGTFLYIPQSHKWRAAWDAFPDLERESDIIDSFEANVGGPLVRDRAWFFAGYAENSTNKLDRLNDGTSADVSFNIENRILKLTAQPNDRHYLSFLGVQSPTAFTFSNLRVGDRFAPCGCDLDAEMLTASWGFTIGPSAFLELKAASQENKLFRDAVKEREIVPGASPDDPLGNQFSYVDRNTNIFYNSLAQPAGKGHRFMPRDQANAALNLFKGDHELKFGADYQDIEEEDFAIVERRYFGFTYDENLVGGFEVPEFVQVYDPAAPTSVKGPIFSVYAQDRIELSDRWILNVGVRLDDQVQENDIGVDAVSWTEVAPRAGATYDVHANGRLLVKLTAGRYVQMHPLGFVAREFQTLPNGTNLYDVFGWNPATERYDIFQRRVEPADPNEVQQVDPYYKDEITAGVSWQFSDLWALETTAQWWELGDLYLANDQFDASGQIYRDIRTWDEAERKYQGIRFVLQRRFRDNWSLGANYTLSKGEGNNFGAGDNVVLFDDDLFEALGGVEVGTGRTDATIVNRYGRGFLDRTHNFNVVGLRQFAIGSHTVALGGYLGFISGERWGIRRATNVAHPVSGQIIRTSTYIQPRDAEQLEDVFRVNVSATWTFPIVSSISGRVGVEVANLTDEQAVIGINRGNGSLLPGTIAYQLPREFRLQAGISF